MVTRLQKKRAFEKEFKEGVAAIRKMQRTLNAFDKKHGLGEFKKTKTTKSKSTHKRLMTLPQKKALIKAIGKNKSMKPASRKAAIKKIKAKKTRKA